MIATWSSQRQPQSIAAGAVATHREREQVSLLQGPLTSHAVENFHGNGSHNGELGMGLG